ncbi:MAG: DNA methyltransferase [Candidatus Hydrogenedentes bacterium]|nr:DNA methyltransferase [Candidatus Hydrogenedentota bacterium]
MKRSQKSEIKTHNIDSASAMFLLNSIDWRFSTPFSVGRSGIRLFDCRKHHWYPATFIPEIPYTLIEILSEPGARILDPFAGIGTTIFQAIMLGRVPYGVELCPVTVHLMHCLWRLFAGLKPELSVDKYAADYCARYCEDKDYVKRILKQRPSFEKLQPWFEQSTFQQLAFIALLELQTKEPVVNSAIEVAFSSTLKAVCAQDRGWGCIADNVLPKPKQTHQIKDAIGRFRRNLSILTNEILKAKISLDKRTSLLLERHSPEEHIFLNDSKLDIPVEDSSIDLVVTSPPYPSMTDYSTSQRLSHYWLGYDPAQFIPQEIGARRKRTKSDALLSYTSDMTAVFKIVSQKVVKRGFVCLVMPRFEGSKHNNGLRKQAVEECLAALPGYGFVREGELTRFLPERRRHHNQCWAKLQREDILVFRRI